MYDGVYFFQDGEVISADALPADRAPHLIPRHMLVTGLGRGGTTACARLVEELGFEAESPTPFRETVHLRRFVQANDPQGALAHLAQWPADGARMFWKDPKMWSPDFEPFMEQLRPDIGILFVFRDPLTIASRNNKWSALDLFTALQKASGATHRMARRLQVLSERNVALVSYEKLLLKPRVVASALARFVDVTDEAKIERAAAVIQPTPSDYEKHFEPQQA